MEKEINKNGEAEKVYQKTIYEMTLKDLMLLMVTDIDIFLLKEENQIDDKNCMFSVKEIRTQLKETLSKFLSFYDHPIIDVYNIPMFKASQLFSIHNSGLSNSEKTKIIKQLKEEWNE